MAAVPVKQDDPRGRLFAFRARRQADLRMKKKGFPLLTIPSGLQRRPSGSTDGRQFLAGLLAVLACALPPMIGAVVPPLSSALNQVTALGGWALVAICASLALGSRPVSLRPALPLLTCCALLCAGILASVLWAGLPGSLALIALGSLATALVLFGVGSACRQAGHVEKLLSQISLGWLVLGIGLALVCFIQVFAPAWADGDWIARTGLPGRAVGNMRQPNHVAVLLCWSCIGTLGLTETARLPRWAAGLLMAAFIWAMVLTASRTGYVGILLLATWGLVDHRLSPFSRRLLMASPLLLLACWGLTDGWAHWSGRVFGGAVRLSAEGASSPARAFIWAETLELIRRNPLTGLGWGEFNFGWALSDFPRHRSSTLDHAHNLPLHLLAELGLPLGLSVLASMGWALLVAVRSALAAPAREGVALRYALAMLLIVGLHSMLEYPLWYFYFLLPTALLLGLCSGGARPGTKTPLALASSDVTAPARTLVYASGWVLAVSVAVWADYQRVVLPYIAPAKALIERGQTSWLFSTWADQLYAATYAGTPEALPAAQRGAHLLVEARSLKAWAQTLNAAGDVERARYLVQRSRDFHEPYLDAWLAECDKPTPTPGEKPFQCTPATRAFTYRDFR